MHGDVLVDVVPAGRLLVVELGTGAGVGGEVEPLAVLRVVLVKGLLVGAITVNRVHLRVDEVGAGVDVIMAVEDAGVAEFGDDRHQLAPLGNLLVPRVRGVGEHVVVLDDELPAYVGVVAVLGVDLPQILDVAVGAVIVEVVGVDVHEQDAVELEPVVTAGLLGVAGTVLLVSVGASEEVLVDRRDVVVTDRRHQRLGAQDVGTVEVLVLGSEDVIVGEPVDLVAQGQQHRRVRVGLPSALHGLDPPVTVDVGVLGVATTGTDLGVTDHEEGEVLVRVHRVGGEGVGLAPATLGSGAVDVLGIGLETLDVAAMEDVVGELRLVDGGGGGGDVGDKLGREGVVLLGRGDGKLQTLLLSLVGDPGEDAIMLVAADLH